MNQDKLTERDRYEARASGMSARESGTDGLVGAAGVNLLIRAPYVYFESEVADHCRAGTSVLEIGAGTGMFTSAAVMSGADVCASDISPAALEICAARYVARGHIRTKVADMERLPFSPEAFDVVTSAGSLSYGDNELVLTEVLRVLRPGGVFIAVDSLNHNPAYRLNRWIRYLRGGTTRSTLRRMPTIQLIERYAERFGTADVRYFGSMSWCTRAFAWFMGAGRAAELSDWVDRKVGVRRSGFKFVLVARKSAGSTAGASQATDGGRPAIPMRRTASLNVRREGRSP